MAEARTDTAPLRNLLDLWERLAECWADSPRAVRLRVAVIARAQSAAPALAHVWLDQALALVAWRAVADDSAREPATVVAYSEWDALRDSSEQLRRRVVEELRSAKSRLTNLLPYAKEQQSLFADLVAYLQQSGDAIAKLAAVPAPTVEPLTLADTILQQIEQSLAALPPGWPPARLAGFLARLPDRDGFAERLRHQLDSSAAEWRRGLGESTSGLSDDLCEIVVLLRGVVETLADGDPASPVWPGLAALARDLLPSDQLQVELIRDPKQPVEWFEPPADAEGHAPRVARVGLALRLVGRDWICFPLGQMVVPKPTPRDEAADGLAGLAAEATWLTRFGPLAGALRDVAPPAVVDRLAAALDALLADVADAAPCVRELPADKTKTIDRALELLRTWAAGRGLEILPRGWRFGGSPSYADLRDDEKGRTALFRAGDPRGAIYRVRTFGLKRGDETLRPCAAAVSAGPLPFGFRELEDLVKNDPAEAAGRDRLAGWRDAALDGTLELTAVQFYVDFWAALGDGLRRRDPDRARDFSERLNDLLQHEFRLFPFRPAAFQDYPDGWVQRTPGRQMETGLVRRVVRPGLHDDQNELRVPALVEVE